MIEDNDYFIIKPYKNRHKHELYIHDKDFKKDLMNCPIFVIKEDLTSVIEFSKKIIYRSSVYGELLKELLGGYLEAPIAADYTQEVKTYFEEKLANIPPHIDIKKGEVRDGYYNYMIKELRKQ